MNRYDKIIWIATAIALCSGLVLVFSYWDYKHYSKENNLVDPNENILTWNNPDPNDWCILMEKSDYKDGYCEKCISISQEFSKIIKEWKSSESGLDIYIKCPGHKEPNESEAKAERAGL